MLGLGEWKPVIGRAEDIVNSPIIKTYDFVVRNCFRQLSKMVSSGGGIRDVIRAPAPPGNRGSTGNA